MRNDLSKGLETARNGEPIKNVARALSEQLGIRAIDMLNDPISHIGFSYAEKYFTLQVVCNESLTELHLVAYANRESFLANPGLRDPFFPEALFTGELQKVIADVASLLRKHGERKP